ncbi:carboxypeptidase-like regulatory domain-containing protein [Rufibacter hautae]|uniref:Carboxypeptidase-like regulatory domain-containing protein n=1 Tax=Rufibacter hautae TaxID=2595005 RepID=A0A5B6TH72_9BACT|nr:carboxypeptidase-like regulatory domain-containing protein [Rufibacter hautae]KAA3439356.1 carboxypeptidase-like regulatory domain-containing protein [Rufibacter hautae]
MKTSFTLLFLLISFLAQAQRIQGKIVDAQSRPLEYVNIGVVGQNVGTVSTSEGQFALSLPEALDQETLQISALGYATQSWKVGDFKQKYGQQSATISLREQAVALKEVVVKPRKYVTKVVGNTTNSKSTTAGFKSNRLGTEIGTVLDVKKPSFLEKVTFNIASNAYDTLFLRINVYRMGPNGPEENVLREPIYLNVAQKDLGDGIMLDLRDRNIYLDADVLLSLELVRNLGGGGLWFSAGLFNKPSYTRETSQGAWEKMTLGGVGFNATISYAK